MALSLASPAAGPDRVELMRAAIKLACKAEGRSDLYKLGHQLPGIDSVDPLPLDTWLVNGWRKIYPLNVGYLTIDWLAPRGHLHHIRLQLNLDDRGTPSVYALVDHRCKIKAARQMRYDENREPISIVHLGSSLQPTGRQEPIDPPVPLADDPGGIPVAIVDTGVNYMLPAIGPRLARDHRGALIGYDYWDLDPRPFDANPDRSAFFPARHGTEVASLIAAEAPIAKLLPYRYPRPDMQRFADLVDHAASQGVRVLNMSLVSFHKSEWSAFEAAMARYPEMLFVVAAGNDRRNIDERPVYPAGLTFPNMITVTAATGKGRLAKDANWGVAAVDLMVPADGVEVIDFDGARRSVTGSSYGAARVTALAACLLAAYPDWPIAKIKDRLFKHAIRSSEDGLVGIGFIPEHVFGQQGACSTRRPNAAI
ncbi:MAG: S8 family serine peptidase [Geminicoccaceae bacterium]